MGRYTGFTHILAVLIVSSFLAAVLIFSKISPVEALTRVRSYFRYDGAFVQSHYRTDRDYTKKNNWSYWGNINPFTGKKGYNR